MAVALTGRGQGVTGHPLHGHGMARHSDVELEVSASNGHAMDEHGKDSWRRMNGQGTSEWHKNGCEVEESGLPSDPGRCVCCPYGYHIDREFLGLLVRSSERNGANLQQLRSLHQRKMRHRQTMESLLMQSIPSSTGNPHQSEPVTPTTSDATESDASSLTEESSMNRDETTASSILSELDETIAEALRSIDELMNAKRKPIDHILTAGIGSSSDTGSASSASQSTPSTSDSSVPLRSQTELTPTDSTTETSTKEHIHNSNPTVQDGKGDGEAGKEITGPEKGTTKPKPPPLHPKPTISFRVGDKGQGSSHLINKIPTKTSSSVGNDSAPVLNGTASDRNGTASDREFPRMNESTIQVKDASKHLEANRVFFPADAAMGTRSAVDDLSSSSDLAKALAVLLPIDGKVGAGGTTEGEALVRLRQYIVSSLRQMRLLEQQVKTIPVMQVRISVLKEEKKLLRLQMLSLQSGFLPPSTAADGGSIPRGSSSLEDRTIASSPLSPPTMPPTLASRLRPFSAVVESVLCSRSISSEPNATRTTILDEMPVDGSHPLEVSNCQDVYGFQQPKPAEEDNRMSTTGDEPRGKRLLCKSISLNPSLLFENRRINAALHRGLEDFHGGNAVRSPTTLTPNASPTAHRRPEATFRRGISLNENSKTVVAYHQSCRELQERIASETSLVRNRWNAKSLEKIVGFRSSPGQELPRTFFNEPIKIRKVSLAQNLPYATVTSSSATGGLLKPAAAPPPHRQSFNAGIQCELLPTKTPIGPVCPRCRSNTNPRRPPLTRTVSHGCGEEAVVNSSNTTIDGGSLSQTPDVIITHRQTGFPGNGLGERTDDRRETNEKLTDGYSSKSDVQLSQIESKEVGCTTDKELFRATKSEAFTSTDRTMFLRYSKDVACLTNVETREASTLTEMLLRDSKEVGCLTDAILRDVVTSEASCLTDKELFEGGSKENSCLSDVPRDDVVTREASTLTEILLRDSKEVDSSTDDDLNRVTISRGVSTFTDWKLLKGSSKEVGCLTDENLSKLMTFEASSSTDLELLNRSSKEIECLTNVSLDDVSTQDASVFTEKEMFEVDSKDVGCLTDKIQLITRDARSMTDRKLFKGFSKDVGCSTDVVLNDVETQDSWSLTDVTMFKGFSKDVGCLTDIPVNDVATQDSWSLTDRAMFKEFSKDVGCLTDVPINDVATQDSWSLTDKAMFKGFSRDVCCLTDVPVSDVATQDSWSLTDKAMFKGFSKDVGCLTDVPANEVATQDSWSLTDKAMFKGFSRDVSCLTDVDLNKLLTRDVICFTEKEMLNEESKEVSCMTDRIPTTDASICTEAFSYEQASQVCSSSQSNSNANESSIGLTVLDACGHVNLTKSNTRDVGCNTEFVFPTDDCKLSKLSESYSSQSSRGGEGLIVSEVNNNVDDIISSGTTKSGFLVGEVSLNSVENFNIVGQMKSLDHSENPGTVIRDTSHSYNQSISTAVVADNTNGDLVVCEKSRGRNLELNGSKNAETRIVSRDISKVTEKPSGPPLETPALNELQPLQVGESFLNEQLASALKTYSTWLQDSTEINTKQLNGSLRVIQQEWFSVSSQKTSSSVHVKQFIDAITTFSLDLKKHVVNMVDTNENTALHYSVSHRNFDLILFLLSTGVCDVNRRNRAGCTAVMLASLVALATDEQRATMRRLIEASDVNVTATLTGQTALMLAASRDHRETARMLLAAKADPNIRDVDGSTALMCASEHGYIAVVKILLSHPGCDPSLRDNEGSTALSVAMEAGHRDVGVLLYAHINFRKQTSQVSGRRHERKGSSSSSSSSFSSSGGSTHHKRP